MKPPEPDELVMGDDHEEQITDSMVNNTMIDRVDEMALETEASDTQSIHQ